jgi:uncharacterized protein
MKKATRSDRRVLEAFLSSPERPEGTFTYRQFLGFLFALTSAPELVPPSEWLPMVFGGGEPSFGSERETQRVIGIMMALYNEAAKAVGDGKVRLPAECAFRTELMENLEPDAPIAEWCTGFSVGHMWLSELWDELVPEEVQEEFSREVLVLSFFTSGSLAGRVVREIARPGKSVEELAVSFRQAFPLAMQSYAATGLAIFRAGLKTMEQDLAADGGPAAPSAAVARNAPCPCGSGKKFKKCCGRVMH